MFIWRRYLGHLTLGSRDGSVPSNTWHVIHRGMARTKPDCWMPVCGVLVKRVPNDVREKCRISGFLMENLFKDDPLMLAAGMGKNDPDPGLIQYYARIANEGKSVYATIGMTKEIIGVCLSTITNMTTAKAMYRQASRLTYDESAKYFKVLATLEEKSNVYRSYNADNAWSIECLCTGRSFRRRGIAKILLKQTKELAKTESDSKIIKFACPNIYGSRATVDCGGMKVLSSRLPTEFKDDKGVHIIKNELCPPHKHLEFFVGTLGRD